MSEGGMLLSPKPGVCQECAVDHKPEDPHNNQSLYYAGWFDGEGSFLLRSYNYGGRPSILVRVSAANTHLSTLKRLEVSFGGKTKPAASKGKPLWAWALHGFHNVLRFCETVGPFLIEKRQEAEVVACYCRRRIAARRKALTKDDLMFVSWMKHVRGYRSTYDPEMYGRIRRKVLA